MLRSAISSIFIALLLIACSESESEEKSGSVSDLPIVQVYKSPTCGCCSKWVAHLEANGFKVEATDVNDMSLIKRSYGIPGALASCHTAVVGDYLVEGHVPAEDIIQLLKQKPAIKGIAVPGMPIGAPGMEMGNRFMPYDILLMKKDGSSEVFASIKSAEDQ